ncbi:PREDICTED: proton-coupled amino acid transporter 1 [Nicrophorus vespilloides]|uniref:Proton-coupled amino acid transporter 1 n=1 Tax=Nicrophorus vespilloides TaxID=110193 RepID=A0ABM1NDK4_NICVS|nr:PREDICTED: proton-coupled amino acid transporter 1 [Nicrophorus vespilloides]
MSQKKNGKLDFGSKTSCQTDLENGDNISLSWFRSSDKIIQTPSDEKSGQIEHPTTYSETLIHILKGNLGSGLFAMGDAIRNSGMVFGPTVIIFLGLICTHCQHLLLTASDKITQRTGIKESPNFAKTVELCFANGPPLTQRMAPVMRKLVNIFLCVTQLGFCCVYFVFISDNIYSVCMSYGVDIDVHLHMLFILLPIIFCSLVRNLKYLAPLSLIANILMAVGFVITIYFLVVEMPPLKDVKLIANLDQIPLFFGTALFAFEGIGLVLPLKNEMKNPSSFQKPFGVLNIGMFLVTILYTTLGSMAFLTYGEDVKGSVTINLPDTPLGTAVRVIIPTAILLSYALQFYIAVDIMWPVVSGACGPLKHPIASELLFRAGLVLVTFALAEAIPYLRLFISLVGAISSTALALLFPPLLEFITCEITAWMVIKNVFILLLGVVGMVTGTYESIHSIVEAFQENAKS